MSSPPTCGDSGGRTKAGKPCRVTMNLGPSGLCLMHDATRRDVARAVSAAGARAQHAKRRKELAARPEKMPRFEPNTLPRVAAWLQWTATSVASGEIDARTAGEVTRALKELRPTLEKVDLERRVRELERALKAARKELEARR